MKKREFQNSEYVFFFPPQLLLCQLKERKWGHHVMKKVQTIPVWQVYAYGKGEGTYETKYGSHSSLG